MFGFAKKLVKQAGGIVAPEMESREPAYGFRIVHVEPDSEAFHSKIEPLFDFVVAANGVRFDRQYLGGEHATISVEQEQSPADDFENVVAATEGRLVLELWSAKGRVTRVVTLPNPAQSGSNLGMSLRWSQLAVADHVWHVLNVVPNSPADQAGLVSHADYIVAAENGVLDSGDEYLLSKVVSRADAHDGVLFFVYNRDYDVLRPVRVFPSADGKLGCGVGYGYLHGLPKALAGAPVPGFTLYDDQAELAFADKSVHVPMPSTASLPTVPLAASPLGAPIGGAADGAAVVGAPPMATAPLRARSPVRNKRIINVDLSSYFDEQIRISNEIDGVKSEKQGVPPPPKSS